MREPLYIVIVAGQSNALGLSPVAGLEESQRKTYENLPIFLDTNYPHPRAGVWQSVRPGLGVDEARFGLEMGVAETLSLQKARYALVKYASDGTSLCDRWNAETRGEDYESLLKTVKRATAGLDGEIRYAGFIWMQGCNDACYESASVEYGKNLRAFIKGVRTEICEDLPFVIGQINPVNPYLPYRERVIEAQKQVAETLKRVRFVATDDLLSLVDNYHYDAPCEWELGKRLAKELLKIK